MRLKDSALMDVEDLAALVPQLPDITKWIKAIEAEAMRRFETGEDVPGYKLVTGRSQRRWVNEEVAANALRKNLKVAEIYPRTLISPAQAEKLLGKGP